MTWLTTLFDQYPSWIRPALAILTAGAMAYGLGEAAARTARWGFLALSGDAAPVDFRSPIVRRPVRVIRLVVMLCGAALLVSPMLRLAGVEVTVGVNPQVLGDWLLGTGLRVATIGILAFATVRVVFLAVRRLELQLTTGEGAAAAERAKRARTICALVRHGLDVVVVGVRS